MSTVKLKRSAVQGKIPTTSDLELGELAINTYDGKLYLKKDDGTASIVDVTSASGISDIIQDLTPQLGGNLDTNGNDILFGDNDKAIFGDGSDLQIFSDGTKSYLIESGSGDLEIRATDFIVKNADNTKIMASFNDGGTVQLRYDNAAKLVTTSTGIDVTGTVTADGLTVDGEVSLTGGDITFQNSANTNYLKLYANTENLFTSGNLMPYDGLNEFSSGNVTGSAGMVHYFEMDPGDGETATPNDTVGNISYYKINASAPDTTTDLIFGKFSYIEQLDSSESIGSFVYANYEAAEIKLGKSTGALGTSAQAQLNGTVTNQTVSHTTLSGNISRAMVYPDSASSNSSISVTTAIGSGSVMFNYGSGTNNTINITDNRGNNSRLSNFLYTGSSGTTLNITNNVAYYAGIYNRDYVSGASTLNITNQYGLQVANDYEIANSVDTMYGVYIEDFSNSANTFYNFYGVAGDAYFGGNVGIGTTTPAAKLDVSGTTRVFSTSGASPISYWWSGGGYRLAINMTDTASGVAVYNTVDGNAQTFQIAGTERLRIDSSGNVGIGTTSPAFTGGSGVEIQRSGTATLRLDSQTFATELRGKTDGTEIFQLSSGYLDLGTNNTSRLRIDASGNVGIGTTAPGSKLHVADGDIQLDEFVINSQTATTTATTQVAIATFSATTYGSAEVVITAKDGSNRHITKLLIVHNGTTATATEFGTVVTSSSLATFDVDISGGNVRVLATPASTNSTVFNLALTLIDA